MYKKTLKVYGEDLNYANNAGRCKRRRDNGGAGN